MSRKRGTDVAPRAGHKASLLPAEEPAQPSANTYEIEARPGVSEALLMAEAVVNPVPRNALIMKSLASSMFGGPQVQMTEAVALVTSAADQVNSGDLKSITAMLTAQALTLDATFTEMTRRAVNNLGQYPEAAQRYMGIALKAQGQARVTVEALAKIVRGNEQVVKHVYVDNRGGQAVIGETIHAGGAGSQIGGQPHEPSPAMLSADSQGDGMPLSCFGGEEAVPAARGAIDGSAEG